MGKGRFFGSIAALGALALVFSWGGGCGIRNDQGISFRALGFFADGTGETGDNGRFADLNNEQTIPNDQDGDGSFDGGFLGIENNMIQGINVERVDLSYRVTGSSLSIPTDSFGMTRRLGPSSGQETTSPPVFFAQIQIVGPQIFQFINQNRGRLPEAPFTMIASARAVGVTDGGDVFETNAANYQIVFVEGQVVVPPPTEAPPTTPTPAPAG